MSNLKTRVARLERQGRIGSMTLIIQNSMEYLSHPEQTKDKPFSKIINGTKIIYVEDDADFSHLL